MLSGGISLKKIINRPEDYADDMLRGIYTAYPEVKSAAGNLRCYCTAEKIPGKVAIVTGGGTGHLPLFLGYVGRGMLDG
jgi:dihydroxyacetone kinase-like protein